MPMGALEKEARSCWNNPALVWMKHSVHRNDTEHYAISSGLKKCKESFYGGGHNAIKYRFV